MKTFTATILETGLETVIQYLPGSQASNSAVSYYLTPSGDVRAVIDNRSGSNQLATAHPADCAGRSNRPSNQARCPAFERAMDRWDIDAANIAHIEYWRARLED